MDAEESSDWEEEEVGERRDEDLLFLACCSATAASAGCQWVWCRCNFTSAREAYAGGIAKDSLQNHYFSTI